MFVAYCPSYYNFRCRMGLCLRGTAYCNGTVECPDGSDEPTNCRREFLLYMMLQDVCLSVHPSVAMQHCAKMTVFEGLRGRTE